MNHENMDMLADLLITLKQAKAVFQNFSDSFTSQPEKETILAIKAQHETFIYTASVVSDLLYNAVNQAEALETAAAAEGIKAV